MKKSFYFLLILIGFSACKKPLQATFQRTPQEQFARESKHKQLSVSNEQLAVEKSLNTNSSILIPNSEFTVPSPQLLVSTEPVAISHRTIIKQKIKPLKTSEIKVLTPAKSIKKANFKVRGNDTFWNSWDKNLKLGVILTGLLIFLAILGVGGLALGIVALFALWYLIRGLKREL